MARTIFSLAFYGAMLAAFLSTNLGMIVFNALVG